MLKKRLEDIEPIIVFQIDYKNLSSGTLQGTDLIT